MERVVECAVKAVAETVAQAGVEPVAVPGAAPEVELLPAVTVVLNSATQAQLVSVSIGVANVLNSR